MFGSKTEDKNKKNASPIVSTASVNSLVQGTRVEGNITAESDFRIDGQLEGNLNCQAKVIIGSTGQVIGDVQCMNAIIEGSFKGNLRVAEVLSVKETAQVTGDVKTDKLIVHSGAVFNVTCTMGSGEKARSTTNADKASAATANN
jgi:cytoskeletal protein CcmA (bactofilin family)